MTCLLFHHGVHDWPVFLDIWLEDADQHSTFSEALDKATVSHHCTFVYGDLHTYLDEVVWRKSGASQARRPNFQNNIGVVPNSAGIDNSSARRFIVVCWELSLKSSSMFDQYCFEALFEEESSVLWSDGNTFLASADYVGRISNVLSK